MVIAFLAPLVSFFLVQKNIIYFFRKFIYNSINNHLEEILFQFSYVYFRGKTTETVEYIPYIEKNINYAGELECNIITIILNFNILVLKYNEDNFYAENYYEFINLK